MLLLLWNEREHLRTRYLSKSRKGVLLYYKRNQKLLFLKSIPVKKNCGKKKEIPRPKMRLWRRQSRSDIMLKVQMQREISADGTRTSAIREQTSAIREQISASREQISASREQTSASREQLGFSLLFSSHPISSRPISTSRSKECISPVPSKPYGFVDVKHLAYLPRNVSELRRCVKIEVPNRPYGLCGRKATLNSNLKRNSDWNICIKNQSETRDDC